ncbi:Arc family DNA-binding protein [Nocardia sp. SYP-A9097]|uniref:FitA-like ribbon-helix-helix domain-containing protein n=1 Tax=Nocardia sp. SYP-A9097 TaxID=2663237 RepID=UPI00129A7EBE|nr:Arc family DNA-binding protein [Nocardia sp. SYP-A9097]MRH89103.1 Arc family DNA-binding protein [Nocardia sp. SYP-A9097]
MAAIHIRNVPEKTLRALRERAHRHGRSMQQELLEIIETATTEPTDSPAPEPIQLTTAHTSGKSTWRREDLYDDSGR